MNYGWVGADAGYGKGAGFCIALDRMSEVFVVDVHSDFFIYLEDPCPYIPEKKTKTGRQVKKYRTDHVPKGVGEVVTSIPDNEWTVMELRNTTRGKLKVSAWKQTVYIWDEGLL